MNLRIEDDFMNIRSATYRDAPAIKLLLEALGFTTSTILLISQLEKLFDQKNQEVFVYELDKDVMGFTAVHYLPQLGFEGELAVITYLSVDETVIDQRIDVSLERYVTEQALKRKCDRVQIRQWRAPAQFYEEQGYKEISKIYIKNLSNK